MKLRALAVMIVLWPVVSSRLPAAAPWESAVQTLRSVGAEGRGNEAAAAAWKTLAGADVAELPGVLAQFDGANDYAVNWLRTGVETIAQRGITAGRPLPLTALEAFLRETKHPARARRLAYDLIRRAEPDRASKLLPAFVNDPAGDLRHEAVAQEVDAAKARVTAGDKAAAIAGFRTALGHSRDAGQIDSLAKLLTEQGEKVNLPDVFGWVTRWKVVGTFTNADRSGFAKVFPPEINQDLQAEYDGPNGKLRWQAHEAKGDYGMLDLNQPFTPLKQVVAYAATEFWSDSARPVELRLGCITAWKVWLNGELLLAREEYHRNSEIDQFRLPTVLKPGRNLIFIKCCQNEQTEDWAKDWEFQLRVTDPQGTPIRSTK